MKEIVKSELHFLQNSSYQIIIISYRIIGVLRNVKYNNIKIKLCGSHEMIYLVVYSAKLFILIIAYRKANPFTSKQFI